MKSFCLSYKNNFLLRKAAKNDQAISNFSVINHLFIFFFK